MSTFANFPTRNGALADLSVTPVTGPSWLARAGSYVWAALERAGEARARRELADLSWRFSASQPEFAKELRAAACRDGGAS